MKARKTGNAEAIKKLRGAGLAPDQLEMAIKALRGSERKQIKINRSAIKAINKALTVKGSCVVKLSQNGNVKVWSEIGLNNVRKHGSRVLTEKHRKEREGEVAVGSL